MQKDEFIKNLQDKLTSAEVQLTKAEQAVADTEAQMATLESIINTQKIDVAESQREVCFYTRFFKERKLFFD